jgi:hypothetical protein
VPIDALDNVLNDALARLLRRPLDVAAFAIVEPADAPRDRHYVQFGTFPDTGRLFIDCPPRLLLGAPCELGDAVSRARVLFRELGVPELTLVVVIEDESASRSGGIGYLVPGFA